MEREAAWLKGEFLDDDMARKDAAYSSGVPFVVLEHEDISPESLMLIPEPLSRAHNIVAYRHGGGEVEVVLLTMDDLSAIDFLRPMFKIKPRLTNRDSIKRALLIYQKHLKEKFAGLVEKGSEAAESLLRHALHSNATHIHLEPAAAALLVRYRINGFLHEAMRLPEQSSKFIKDKLKSLAKLFPVETSAQEGRFTFEHMGESVSVRVSTTPAALGERMTMRLAKARQGQKGFTLDSLGFHGEGLERLHELLAKLAGLLVVLGPQGSGKTTTLYTLLDELNHTGVAIATIEKKVEYALPHIAQTEVRPDVGLDTLAGLRAILRADPDAVMISDMDTRDTAEVAVSAAKRGVLVLAGLDARSPDAALELLEPYMPKAVIAQRLVKKLCQHCKESYKPTREEFAILESAANFGRVLFALKEEDVVNKDTPWKEVAFYRAKPIGCDKCKFGYKGVLGVQSIVEEVGEGLTLIEDAVFKAAQGLTSVEEVINLI